VGESSLGRRDERRRFPEPKEARLGYGRGQTIKQTNFSPGGGEKKQAGMEGEGEAGFSLLMSRFPPSTTLQAKLKLLGTPPQPSKTKRQDSLIIFVGHLFINKAKEHGS